MTLKTKLNSIFAGLSLLLILAIALLYGSYSRKLRAEARARMNANRHIAQLMLENHLEEMQKLALAYANDAVLRFFMGDDQGFQTKLAQHLHSISQESHIDKALIVWQENQHAEAFFAYAEGQLSLMATAPVYDRNNVHKGTLQISRALDKSGLLDDIAQQTAFRVELASQQIMQAWTVSLPLQSSQDYAAGWIALSSNPQQLQAVQQQAVAIAAVSIIAGLAALLLIQRALHTNITMPLQALIDASHAVQQGNFAMTLAPQRNEIGILSAAFQEMAAALLEQQQQREQEERERERERQQEQQQERETRERLQAENTRLRELTQTRDRFGQIIGRSLPMQQIYELLPRTAQCNDTVLITGETGTGKGLLAHTLHQHSERKNKPFVPVNCGAIPEQLFEREFFGHVKGAFTGADRTVKGFLKHAEGGTLFLDEVGELPLSMQIKLLHLLDGDGYTPIGTSSKHYPDIRIITASNQNFERLIKNGDLREDFFYRINILPLELPPLRQRKDDIPLLIEHFLQHYDVEDAPERLYEQFQTYPWPGNVRELKNTIARILAGHSGIQQAQDSRVHAASLQESLDAYEKGLIETALIQTGGHRETTAELLSISESSLYRKIKKFGLS